MRLMRITNIRVTLLAPEKWNENWKSFGATGPSVRNMMAFNPVITMRTKLVSAYPLLDKRGVWIIA
jgi:hypothetical protein